MSKKLANPMSFRPGPTLRKLLHRLAADHGLSTAQAIRRLVEQGVADWHVPGMARKPKPQDIDAELEIVRSERTNPD